MASAWKVSDFPRRAGAVCIASPCSGFCASPPVALGSAAGLQRQVRQRTAALAVSNATLRDEVGAREKAKAGRARAQERDLRELKNRFISMVSSTVFEILFAFPEIHATL